LKGAQDVAQNHRRDFVRAVPLRICKLLESNGGVEENLMAVIEKSWIRLEVLSKSARALKRTTEDMVIGKAS
jgi:hypothetical protein